MFVEFPKISQNQISLLVCKDACRLRIYRGGYVVVTITLWSVLDDVFIRWDLKLPFKFNPPAYYKCQRGSFGKSFRLLLRNQKG